MLVASFSRSKHLFLIFNYFRVMILAIIVGLILGLLGGGGSILAVPVLVYFLDINPVQATAYSLFIVGITAFIGASKQFVIKNINIKIGFLFGLPSFLGVFISRYWLLPNLPDILFTYKNYVVNKEMSLMILFSFLMLTSAIAMFFKSKKLNINHGNKIFMIIIDGLLIGVVTGLVGAGGGFLIVPALVLFFGLDFKKAIGTSLMVISFKSIFGFFVEINNINDWKLLFIFTLLSVVGLFIGLFLSNYITFKYFKKTYAFFLIILSFLILFKEFAII